MAKEKFPDLSIDCETLGLGTNPAIISIGAQLFNRQTSKLGPSAYYEIDFNSAMKAGQIHGSTLAWWMDQGNEARRIFAQDEASLRNKLPLATALCALISFLRDDSTHDVRVWANGPCADVTWIESAFEKGSVGLSMPWNYRNVRCYRTLVDAAEATGWSHHQVMWTGVRHNALADAKYQAHVLMTAWNVLTKGKSVQPVAPVTVDDDDDI